MYYYLNDLWFLSHINGFLLKLFDLSNIYFMKFQIRYMYGYLDNVLPKGWQFIGIGEKDNKIFIVINVY